MASSLRWCTCFVFFWTALGLAHGASVLVAFKTTDAGGLARIEIDEAGLVTKPAVVLMRAPSFKALNKLRVTADGQKAVLDASVEGAPNLALIDLEEAPVTPARLVNLNFEPDEIRLTKDRAFVGGSDGWVISIDLRTGETIGRWNAREQLNPPGHKPEDLRVLEAENLLLVTLQKDGKKGRKGSRVVALGLSDLRQVSDHPLARDHPELHLSEKESGPSPEVIEVDRVSGTVLVTMDLYGALMFAPLSEIAGGEDLGKTTVLPTSDDGSWGTAFPDRVALVKQGAGTFAFVSNAAVNGGIAVFDVAARKRVGFLPVEAGCDYFVPLNGGKQLATVVSGKIKKRGSAEVTKSEEPGTELLLIDVTRAVRGDAGVSATGKTGVGDNRADKNGAGDVMKRIPLGAPVTRITGIAGSDHLVAVALAGKNPEIVLYDTAALREVERVTVPGVVVGLATAP